MSSGHWGTHLDHYPFLHHSKQRGVVVPPISSRQFQDLEVTSINLFLTGISFSFSDRMHRIHPCGVVFFSPLLLAFNLINNDGVIFRSDYDGFICWSVITHHQAQ